MRNMRRGDSGDQAFWDEFYKRREKKAPVTLVVEDKSTGRKWVLKKVKLVRKKLETGGEN
jgi:hypothetical protein